MTAKYGVLQAFKSNFLKRFFSQHLFPFCLLIASINLVIVCSLRDTLTKFIGQSSPKRFVTSHFFFSIPPPVVYQPATAEASKQQRAPESQYRKEKSFDERVQRSMVMWKCVTKDVNSTFSSSPSPTAQKKTIGTCGVCMCEWRDEYIKNKLPTQLRARIAVHEAVWR